MVSRVDRQTWILGVHVTGKEEEERSFRSVQTSVGRMDDDHILWLNEVSRNNFA